MPPAGYPDPITGPGQLRTLLQNKACLLLLDDVWEPDRVRPFFVGGPRCLLLVTTRKLDVADAIGATAIELAPMTVAESLSLMERWCGALTAGDRDIAMSLGNEVGWLPFALELMAGQAKSLGWQSYRERWRSLILQLSRGIESYRLLLPSLMPADTRQFLTTGHDEEGHDEGKFR